MSRFQKIAGPRVLLTKLDSREKKSFKASIGKCNFVQKKNVSFDPQKMNFRLCCIFVQLTMFF